MKEIDLFELKREVFHIIVGILFVIGIMYIPHAQLIGIILLVFGFFLSIFATQFKIPLISKGLEIFERESDKNFPGKGVLFFFAGALLSLQLFSRNIALASILILTFGDPIAHFVGANFGKINSQMNRNKNLEGTLAGIAVGGIFASFFVPVFPAFIGASIAMIIELVGVKIGREKIDDNLLIPLIAGLVIYLISFV
jgi:dolichol kinase